MTKYAILFIPDASYLYQEKERENIPGTSYYEVDTNQSECLYTHQETKDADRSYQLFDLRFFDTKEEAEARFTETFWCNIPGRTYVNSAYIEYNGEKYSLIEEKDRIYFDIVEIKK